MHSRSLLIPAATGLLAVLTACGRDAAITQPSASPPSAPSANMVSTVARYVAVCTGTGSPAGTYTYSIGPIVKLAYNGEFTTATATLLVTNPVDIAPGTCVDVIRLDGAPLYVGLDPRTQVTVTQTVRPAGTLLAYTQTSEQLVSPPICLGPPPPDAATCIGDIYGNSSTVTTTLNWYHGSAISFWHTPTTTVEIEKLVTGGGSLSGYTFEVRSGASIAVDGEGTAVATATTSASGVGLWAVTAAGLTAGATASNAAVLVLNPGTYQLCETNLLPGWTSSLSSLSGAFVPAALDPEVDNSTICIELVASATTVTNIDLTITNDPPPEGEARTIGFWKNWSSCSGGSQDDVLDQTLAGFPIAGGQSTPGVFIGDLYVNTCLEAIRILDKSAVNNGKKQASDAAYGLAAQLLAAVLNVEAEATTCPALTTAITSAQTLLAAIDFDGTGSYLGSKVKGAALAQRNQANALASTLDQYNNNLLCTP